MCENPDRSDHQSPWAPSAVQCVPTAQGVQVQMAITGCKRGHVRRGEAEAPTLPLALVKAAEGVLTGEPLGRKAQEIKILAAHMEGPFFCIVVKGRAHPVAHYGMCPNTTELGMAEGCLQAMHHLLRSPEEASWFSVL